MKTLLSPDPILLNQALATVRIIVGLLLAYHGQEVFDPALMQTYMTWDTFKGNSAAFMVYAGKSSEFIAGVLLTLGLFTRVGALLAAGTLGYITFFVGQGRFWYEDQHPFMFVLFGLLYFFTGPGMWSLDGYVFKKKTS
jgi:putative oxidoreductase